MSIDHNRIKVADLEQNEPNKILTTNTIGELEFSDINNDLDCIVAGKVLDARQGKILKDLIDNINALLISDNINLNTVQELVDAIEAIQASLGTILVNDLTTGGTTKALTAEQGKILKGLVDTLTTNDTNKSLQDVVTVNKRADEVEFTKIFRSGKSFVNVAAGAANTYIIDSTNASDGGFFYFGNFSGYDTNTVLRDVVKINNDGSINTLFNVGSGLSTTAMGGESTHYTGNRIIELSNGNVLITGTFNYYKGVLCPRNIITLDSTGNMVTMGTNTGFNNITVGAAVADSKIYVTGRFTTYNGITTGYGLIKLNLDGTIDTSLITGTGFNNTSNDIIVNDDGTLIVAGYFGAYKGVACKNIIKLLPDGSKDTYFNPASGFVPGGAGSPNFICKTPDGKILATGFFTSYNGIARGHIIKLNQDGTEDTSFVSGTGLNDIAPVKPKLIMNNTKYLIQGYFTEYNGTPTNGLVVLNLDGTIYKTFTDNIEGPLEVDGNMIGRAYGGDYDGKLVTVIDDLQYPELKNQLSFDKTTGKAEYLMGGLADLSEDELVPKRLVQEMVNQTSSPLTRLTSIPVFPDNSAALLGNLVPTDIYKTTTGQLMIVY